MKKDGEKELIKMSNTEERIKDIWEEVIVKERLKTLINKIEEDQTSSRKIIKEELTELWNISEIPTFKQILEKLTTIQNCLEQKQVKSNFIKNEEPELVDVNALGMHKESIKMDISKSKPKLTKGVKKVINNLAELHKVGKF